MSRDIIKWDEINGAAEETPKIEAFLTDSTNTYAILQLRYSDETRDERFESYSALQRLGRQPDVDHYEMVYTAPLLPYVDQSMMLEGLYDKFNADRPDDFHGHSLSVSDVIAIRQNGTLSAHYVDSVSFTPLPGFFTDRNHIRTVEDMIEQNDNQLDDVINNLSDEPQPCKCQEEKKESILSQLHEMKQEQNFPDASGLFDKERNLE